MSTVTPEDVGRAGRGDLEALRRLRGYWLALATGEAFNPLLPKDEALPQVELLAELAASATQEAQDWIALLVVYHVRLETLTRHASASEEFAEQAVKAGNAADLDRWTRSVVEFRERAAHYRSKAEGIFVHLLDGENPEGAAMLINALSIQADEGDELSRSTLGWCKETQ